MITHSALSRIFCIPVVTEYLTILVCVLESYNSRHPMCPWTYSPKCSLQSQRN
ncbi:hypothetical protein X975_10779, partial [Stegodyphus mimosarum]